MMKTINSGVASDKLNKAIAAKIGGVQGEIAARTYRASNELRTASLYVLRGQRSGRVYRIPSTKKYYTASKAGESPAVRTGIFRLSWETGASAQKNAGQFEARASIKSGIKVGGYILGDILEEGTGKMAARPYKQKVIDMAVPKIREIYKSLL